MHEFSRLLKEAEASDWDEEHTRRADAVFDEGAQLHREYSALLDQMESGLSEEERNTLDRMEENRDSRSRNRPDSSRKILRQTRFHLIRSSRLKTRSKGAWITSWLTCPVNG